VDVVKPPRVGQPVFVLDCGWPAPVDRTRLQRGYYEHKTPNTEPPMPGSELFIHNVDSAPAYWWLDDLRIVLADGKDTGGR
jgi:hypothetical protein